MLLMNDTVEGYWLPVSTKQSDIWLYSEAGTTEQEVLNAASIIHFEIMFRNHDPRSV